MADSIRDGAHQLAVDVHRTAAHAGDHAGVFHLFAMQTREDQVALGTVEVWKNAEDFNVHGLGLHSLEDRVGDTAHTPVDLAHLQDLRSYTRLCDGSC